MNENKLQHFGILGMKWGIRRYQNKDGSLTTAGKKRLKKDMTKDRAEFNREYRKKHPNKRLQKFQNDLYEKYNSASDKVRNGKEFMDLINKEARMVDAENAKQYKYSTDRLVEKYGQATYNEVFKKSK